MTRRIDRAEENVNSSVSVRLYADVVHSYSRGVLRGIADYAKIHGNWNFSFNSRIDPDFLDSLQTDQVAGVIIQIRRREQADALVQAKIRAVNVGYVVAGGPLLPSVISDDHAVGRMAANYFIERGFQSFAFCGYPALDYSERRREGYAAELHAHGRDCTGMDRTADDAGPDPEADRKRTKALLDLPRPLAIFCCNDSCARETVNEAVKLGAHVPDDIAVLGVDNDEINCELSGVQLSSIRLNTEQIGYEAATLLAKLLAGQTAPSDPIRIAPIEVITRRSTDVLALEDSEVAASVRFIRDRGGREINVEDLLERTALSRRSLEMRFRKALGRSPYQEIRRVQLERAKLLLSSTDRSVREIADACGFKEARQLSTAFHDRIGLTPRQYRRRARQDAGLSEETPGYSSEGSRDSDSETR